MLRPAHLQERLVLFAAVCALWALVYFGIGQWAIVRATVVFDWDPARAVPLASVFVIPYLSAYVMPLFVIFSIRSYSTYRIYAATVAGAIIVSAAFFALMPLTIDRPEILGASIFDRLLAHLYATDRPTNLFPSLHVSLAFLFAFGASLDHPRRKLWMLAWAWLIAVSTIFTRQHYVVDALAGALLAWVAWRIFLRMTK